ncbi:MAG: N-acetylmuramic acid 6-phosphate etherase, partial [Tissierellia bacterium]|nr:N-acetylmuramic acid 6-phosphate etherase [Tissierellia bacterium]
MEIISTEKRNKYSQDIDIQSTKEILRRINEEDKKVAYIVEEAIADIEKVVDLIDQAIKKGHRVFYIGSGTSGRLGVLDASECPPTYGVSTDLFNGIIAGGDRALRYSIEGAEDFEKLAEEDLEQKGFQKGDVLIGIAASGRTPYVIGALKYANHLKCPTAAISCVKNSKIGKIADIAIEVETGAEIVTGSTRMKAGTAQKLILNMISTAVMIKQGKVYNGLMVDVKPVNKKLIQRSINIIKEIVACSEDEAKRYLEDAGQDVKVAIILGLTKM